MATRASNFELENAGSFLGEEGVSLVAGRSGGGGGGESSRELGDDNPSRRRWTGNALFATCGKCGGLLFGLLALAVTYQFGRDVGQSGGYGSGGVDEGYHYTQLRPAIEADHFENATTATSSGTATAADTQATTTTTTTTAATMAAATPVPPSPHPTLKATTAAATTAADIPVPPSPHPTLKATTASLTTKATDTETMEPATTTWIPEPNPFVAKFNTSEWISFHKKQWEERVENAIDIHEKYGIYCPKEPNVPMCPVLSVDADDKIVLPAKEVLAVGPTVICNDTGTQNQRCGRNDPWLNKTIWPLLRGPLCAAQDAERQRRFPLPDDLAPYMELGYDRADPTLSTDADPFDGGALTPSTLGPPLTFEPAKMKEHFLKFEAMLEHHYQGLARPLLERQLSPTSEDPLYAPMLQAYADQIARALLRAAREWHNGEEGGATATKMVIGVLGDSVTSGTDNCYYDAWPEQLRRQIAPLFAAMGIELEIRNAAKNGGWNMASQLMCAHDMLGVSDRPGDLGLDFLLICNPFVTALAVDAEHAIRRALLGKSHTVLSIVHKNFKGFEQKLMERYSGAGLTIGTPFGNAVPELGIPNVGYRYWFPDQDRAFWGMQGDGFCHLTTRSGSAAVVNRNWHWGPKAHQTYADAYALLFSRATRQAIDDLSAERTPPEPPTYDAFVDTVTQRKEKPAEEEEEDPPTWKDLLSSDMESKEAVSEGLGGVRCAVGSGNQPGSILLPHWLRPAEGSPFEEVMKSRNGVSFVPSDHDKEGSDFYRVSSPISTPNQAVLVGEWVANPNTFGAEAPRSSDQCRHVDGSTMVNMNYKNKPAGVSWVVWEMPPGAVTIGRAMMCHPRSSKKKLAEDAFDNGNVRVHYAVPNGNEGWKLVEDAHKIKPVNFAGQECTPVVGEMEDTDLKAAREGGVWVAVEWKEEGVFDFDYLVAM